VDEAIGGEAGFVGDGVFDELEGLDGLDGLEGCVGLKNRDVLGIFNGLGR